MVLRSGCLIRFIVHHAYIVLRIVYDCEDHDKLRIDGPSLIRPVHGKIRRVTAQQDVGFERGHANKTIERYRLLRWLGNEKSVVESNVQCSVDSRDM